MESGRMFFYQDPKKSLSDIIRHLTKTYRLENVKHVLVHPDATDKEITVDNVKIKPKKGVLLHHYWFISENKAEIYPKFEKSEK